MPGHASDPRDGRGARRLEARAVGRGEGTAAAIARRRAEDRCARRIQGRSGGGVKAHRNKPALNLSRLI